MALPGETEAGSAGKQPCRGIARRAHRDDDHGRGTHLSRSSQNPIGSKDPDALKIPARRAASTLTRSARSPVPAEPAHEDFGGVLVSDFYSGYDAVDCAQQKCLIHLMRDLNEDLRKQPFNDEMTEIARKFASLVKPMIESVDRFGLKTYHLRKHNHAVDGFIVGSPSETTRPKWRVLSKSGSRRIATRCLLSWTTMGCRGTRITPNTP